MDPQIKTFQDFLKTSPLGVSFPGPSNGEMSPELKNSANALQASLKDKLSKSPNVELQNKGKSLSIISGDKITTTPEIIKSLINDLSKDAQPKDAQQPDNNIKAIQEVFNQNPFGIAYSGPKDGIIGPELIQKAQQLESEIAKLTGANTAGQIIANNKFTTNASDLNNTFQLLKSYQEFLKTKKNP